MIYYAWKNLKKTENFFEKSALLWNDQIDLTDGR